MHGVVGSAGPDRHGSPSPSAVTTVTRPADPTTWSSPALASPAIDYPTDADHLVLFVDAVGGYWAPAFELVHLPSWSLFGDGRLYQSAPSRLRPTRENFGYSNANELPTITVTDLEPEQLRALLAQAYEAGLLDPDLTFGPGLIEDSDDLVVLFDLGDRGIRHLVEGAPREGRAGEVRTAEDDAARRSVNGFLARLSRLAESGAEPYVPDAIIVNRMDPAQSYADPDTFGPPHTLPWPVDSVPPPVREGETRSCLVISGDEVEPLLAALAKATPTTTWTTPDGPMEWVQFRPAFPGGSNGC